MKIISTPETAKLVRSALKKSFPLIKFSVISNSYSGGASISVTWTDGPTTKQVEKITKYYEGSTFDGRTDSQTSRTFLLNGERVQSCANSISCLRQVSVALFTAAAAKVVKQYGVTAPEIRQGRHEAFVVEDYTQRIGEDTVARIVIQTAYQMSA